MKPLFRSPTGGATLGPVPGSEFHNDRHDHLHGGIDLNCGRYDLIAPRAGRVMIVGVSLGLGGNKVEIDHGILDDGLRHYTKHYHFGHKFQPWQDCIYVREGDRVQAGQPLGVAGDSGNASAVHDHYEHYLNGRAVDPLCYLREYQVVRRLLTGERYGLFYPNSESADVLAAQIRLIRHGFIVAADGVYGPQSQRMMRHFQEVRGLPADGVVGRDTWRALLRKVAL